MSDEHVNRYDAGDAVYAWINNNYDQFLIAVREGVTDAFDRVLLARGERHWGFDVPEAKAAMYGTIRDGVERAFSEQSVRKGIRAR